MTGPVDIHRLLLDLHQVSAGRMNDELPPDAEYLRELCCRSLIAMGQIGYGHREQILALGQRLTELGERITQGHA
jgi:hypothetical protein